MKRDEEDDYAKLDIRGTSLWNAPAAEGRSVTMQDLSLFFVMLKNVYRGLLEDNEFLNRLRNSQFDVALHEVYEPIFCCHFRGELRERALTGYLQFCHCCVRGETLICHLDNWCDENRCSFGFWHDAVRLRNCRHSTKPELCSRMYSTYSDDMTFWERLNNFKYEIELDFHYRNWERELWTHFNDVYPGFPDFRELLKRKVGVVLLNINEFTETPRPTANIVRYIGGLAVHAPKQLEKNLDAVLDKRSSNVLLSFGTISRSKDMPLWLKKDIVHAFSSFPNTTFIWKYEDENDSHLFKDHPNIYAMKWVPQSDLLGDRRLSAFITHAGMNSILEATFSGKPLVVVPLFGDQYINARNVQRRGTAVMIDRNELNKETLTAAIREVLSANSDAHRAATVPHDVARRTGSCCTS
ncbi:glycosyltransferase family 28 protein [Ostertagia ostertagi]